MATRVALCVQLYYITDLNRKFKQMVLVSGEMHRKPHYIYRMFPSRIAVKPGLWTVDWTGLDYGLIIVQGGVFLPLTSIWAFSEVASVGLDIEFMIKITMQLLQYFIFYSA